MNKEQNDLGDAASEQAAGLSAISPAKAPEDAALLGSVGVILTVAYFMSRANGNSVCSGEVPVRRSQGTGCLHCVPVSVGQFGKRMLFAPHPFASASTRPTLTNAISVVDGNRSGEKMCRIAANAIVAGVTSNFINSETGSSQFYGTAMGANHFPFFLKGSISTSTAPIPRPAIVRTTDVNPFPKF